MSAAAHRLASTVESFRTRAIVVVGDLIADEYLFGKPSRISREAPVLILRYTERQVLLGGAANATHNVHALGARVVPVGVVGRDAPGDELLGLLHAAGIPTDGIVTENGRASWPAATRRRASRWYASTGNPRATCRRSPRMR
jgi:bifunctional ADP-heptose synthase (sugar kinase/adenylyltransferase)